MNSQMHLYDLELKELSALLQGSKCSHLPFNPWPCTPQESLVLRGDCACELGGGGKPAVSGIGFTTDETLVPESGVYLIGPDLQEAGSLQNPGEEPARGELAGRAVQAPSADVPYARITLLLLDSECGRSSAQEWHGLLQKLDYCRYHVFPDGYMMRISSVKEREQVRVSKEAMQKGISFAGVGESFLQVYLKFSEVNAAQILFVTDPDFDYGFLQKTAHRFQQITQSLDQVFRGLKMDCSTCGQRELCQEIDGLKALHQSLV